MFGEQGFVSGSMLIIFMASHPKVSIIMALFTLDSWLSQTLNCFSVSETLLKVSGHPRIPDL